MFTNRIFSSIRSNLVNKSLCRHLTQSTRLLRDTKVENDTEIAGSVATRFKIFKNDDSGIIYDVEEERAKIETEDKQQKTKIDQLAFDICSQKRGVTGVFEIEELVEVITKDNAKNICVLRVPKELKYVDYLCIIECTSYRHMIGIAEFVRKLFKVKRNSSDIIPKIEGEESKEWIAMDLGNIALHIFSKKARQHYDLESLWCLGEEYERLIKFAKNSNDDDIDSIINEVSSSNQQTSNEKENSV